MANIGEDDKGYEGMASSAGVLAAERSSEPPRWQVWCWPALVLAGIVVWLTLVALAGATTLPARAADPAVPACSAPQALTRAAAQSMATFSTTCRLRTGFTPRRP